MLKDGLVWERDGIGDRLGQNGFRSVDVSRWDLKTNTANKVRYLPVETHEVLVFEKAKDAG